MAAAYVRVDWRDCSICLGGGCDWCGFTGEEEVWPLFFDEDDMEGPGACEDLAAPREG